jgi:hypothetical protein
MHTGFWWGNAKERGYLEDLGVADRMILMALKQQDGRGRLD